MHAAQLCLRGRGVCHDGAELFKPTHFYDVCLGEPDGFLRRSASGADATRLVATDLVVT
jgi:hypothetical protein